MANIPKKVLDRFARAIPRFQAVLRSAKDRDINESDTASIIQDVLAEVFGYQKYSEITTELAIRGTYCDIALKVEEKFEFLIEVKAIGSDLRIGYVKQAVDYGANKGVPWVILTNGTSWRLYRVLFEQPLDTLVFEFDFLALDPKSERDQELLFILSREGLAKKTREEYFEKVQNVNRFTIGAVVLCEPVVSSIRRELRRLADGMKIEQEEIESILREEVLKRELVEGEEAILAQTRVNKFYKKAARKASRADQAAVIPLEGVPNELVAPAPGLTPMPGESSAAPILPSA